MSRIGSLQRSRYEPCKHHGLAPLITVRESEDSSDYLIYCAECAANTLIHLLIPLQPPQESD